ncbi:MAG: sigma factor-like helix-turn-helix DNA-binding protein, partial [Gammaproteobacteria bacterium]
LEDDDDEGKLGDWIGVIDDGFAHVETRLTAVALLNLNTSREREVLRMRFEHDITHAEIAEAIGISDTRVAEIIEVALARMRSAMLE